MKRDARSAGQGKPITNSLMREFCLLACVLSLFVFVIVGCAGPAPKPAPRSAMDYANAYKALMIRYHDAGVSLVARPLPPKSLPAKQKRALLAQQVRDLADWNADYAGRLHRLTPPTEFAEIHVSSEAFLKTMADGNYRWADAILHGNRANRNSVLKATEEAELKASQRMQDTLKRAGGSSKQLDSLVKELQQSNK